MINVTEQEKSIGSNMQEDKGKEEWVKRLHKTFSERTKDSLQLSDSEHKCPNCNGSGINPYSGIPYFVSCFLCRGTGKVDWVKYARYVKNGK